jgi:hypothetical protein
MLHPVVVIWTISIFLLIGVFYDMDRIVLSFCPPLFMAKVAFDDVLSVSDGASRLVSRTIVACQCIVSRSLAYLCGDVREHSTAMGS